MSLCVMSFAALIKKSAVKRRYPGGLAAFRRDFPHGVEDAYLIALTGVSTEALRRDLDQIGATVLGVGDGDAVVLTDESIPRHPHFEFVSPPDQGAGRGQWQVRLIDDAREVLAEEGIRLLRHLMRNDFSFDLPEDGP